MVVLLLLGIAAGLVTVSYWSAQSRAIKQRAKQEGTGAARTEQQPVDPALDELTRAFEQVVAEGRSIGSLADAVQQVVGQYPKHAPTRTLLGQVLLYGGQSEKAYQQLAISLRLDGQQPEVHLLCGTIAYRLGRIGQATDHYAKAVDLDPSNPRYRLHLAQAYNQAQQRDRAKEVLVEALRIDSSLHEAQAALADIYAEQGHFELALTQIQKAIEQTPVSQKSRWAQYHRRKAALLRQDNNPQEALLTLQSLHAEHIDPELLSELATCWSMMGQPDRAATLYEDAIAADPTEPSLVVGATHWRIKAGDHDLARQHLDRLRQLNGRTAMVAQLEGQLD